MDAVKMRLKVIMKGAVSVNFQNHKCQIFTRRIKIAAIGSREEGWWKDFNK